jgi:ubiquinone/menaquinone biosynthesis C-methylase UbiE
MSEEIDFKRAERYRIRSEYERRAREISPNLYAPWDRAAVFIESSSRRDAPGMLHRARVFPGADSCCLEVGFGTAGWLADLIKWGVKETSLAGIDLDERRVESAREKLPGAELKVGDAAEMPWFDETFDLVVASRVLTSILDQGVRHVVADEITRVLKSRGALLWYDFAFDNPRNPNVRKVGRAEVRRLFPKLAGIVKRATLAPPIARAIAPYSWSLATLLEAVPFLRTHLLGVLVKA